MSERTVISEWDGVSRQDSISRWRERGESLSLGMRERIRPTKGDIRRMDDRHAWAGCRWCSPRYEVNASSFQGGSSMHSKSSTGAPPSCAGSTCTTESATRRMQGQLATETYPEGRPSCTERGTWDASSCGLPGASRQTSTPGRGSFPGALRFAKHVC